jgi:hypothetical protein
MGIYDQEGENLNDDNGVIEEAKEFLKFCNQADSNNRVEALEDLKFAAGDQWPVEIQNSRLLEARPFLTINKVDAYCRQIENQQRQARPRMRATGMNSESDEKVAEVITGLLRHIEYQSDADAAYDTAFSFAVRMGWGFFRVVYDFKDPNSFEQEIYIKRIDNPFTVYFDPNSKMYDGSDAEKCLITEMIPRETFRKMYPDVDDEINFSQRGTGDSQNEWITREDIRLAEYFYTVYTNKTIVLLSDGTSVPADEMPSQDMMLEAGVYEVQRRVTTEKKIKWVKMTGDTIIDRKDWPGKYIPVIPVYGQELVVDAKRKKFGLTRMAKDPQRMYNFWATSLTESVALAPKAKYLLAEGQDEGHEIEWTQANIKSMPVLRYKQTDSEGREAPPPIRVNPEPPPQGMVTALQGLDMDLKAVVGIYDPTQLPNGNQSGKAINGMQQQTDMTNFHYFDNLTRSINQAGRICLDLIPIIYSEPRMMRIIGADGKGEMTPINTATVDEMGVDKIKNDLTVGEYDIVMETGPGYASKRQEAAAAMTEMVQADPTLMQVAGDLLFRNLDFPGADVIADRMAATNPLAQIDDKSEVPPMAQMMIKQGQQQIQELQQQLQALQMDMKYGASVAQQKEAAATERTKMQVDGKKYDTEIRAEVVANDTIVKTETQKDIEIMKAQLAMLLAQMDLGNLHKAETQAIERGI